MTVSGDLRIVVADDHPLVRRGVTHAVSGLAPRAEVREAASLAEVLAAIAVKPEPDLVLLDLRMPGMEAPAALARVLDAAPAVPVVVLSADETAETALAALQEGVAGYLLKSMPEEIILSALRLVLSGGVYVPPVVLQRDVLRRPAGRVLPLLTERQRAIVPLMIEGLSNREIADRLGVAVATVKAHVTAVLKAYGVASRAKAVKAARAEVAGTAGSRGAAARPACPG